MKKQIKTKKPEVIVNLTDAETPEDVRYSFIMAKARAGVAITEQDVDWLINVGAKAIAEVIIVERNKLYNQLVKTFDKAVNPKEPWYKRFWNWLKKPFTKKK